ncbi:hypothetical protein B0H19DRAFT_1087761 [Mycena capillaripes]|nr:hypothetical protein B0H19DRAFT_1087761 [Mycena capillaripes]
MAPFPRIRLVVLSTDSLFSMIALGVAAALMSTDATLSESYFSYVVTAVLTMTTLPAMLAFEIWLLRQDNC